jgi:enamine deaminase RidA (YjgF/YER057c/UK114 family)
MSKRAALLSGAVLLLVSQPAVAQPSPSFPRKLPTPGGEVLIPDQRAQQAYDQIKFAPARRVGDMLYISGGLAGFREGEARTIDVFKESTRRLFGRIDALLKLEGASFADVVKINSFHVWKSPDWQFGKREQFDAFSAVKDEFMSAPYSAWTAVGTTELLGDRLVVEAEFIAYVPQDRRPRR